MAFLGAHNISHKSVTQRSLFITERQLGLQLSGKVTIFSEVIININTD